MEQKEKKIDEMFCSSCGEIIKKEAEICPKCGVRQKEISHNYNKDKNIAGILALFLGGLGIHKFYLNQAGQGILYLCFCWTFIPAIIAFIEAIIYFTMNEKEFKRKYN